MRFDVLMPPYLAQDMQDLEQQTGLSRGEIFRRAMALYKRAKEATSTGGKCNSSRFGRHVARSDRHLIPVFFAR
jgi:hypothetical protein